MQTDKTPGKDVSSQNAVSPDALTLDADTCQQVLAECLELFATTLHGAARLSIETATDLFEKHEVDDKDELGFLTGRETWLVQFDQKMRTLIQRRFAGHRRSGRRPDPDVSLATLRVLNPFDQEKQAAIAQAVRVLARWSRKELDALDVRIAELLREPVVRDVDNPFAPDYVVDAIGASARGMFPNPRIWRPFMERVLTDITPSVPKAYITLNRLLADHGVLPEIKAALRARSEHRPADDKDLFPAFSRLLEEAGPDVETIDIDVPPIGASFIDEEDASSLARADAVVEATPAGEEARQAPDARLTASEREAPLLDVPVPATPPRAEGHVPLPVVAATSPAPSGDGLRRMAGGTLLQMAALPDAAPVNPHSSETRAAVEATAAMWPGSAPPPTRAPARADDGFPSVDPLLTLGSSSPVFEVLAQWQNFDPRNEGTQRELKARGVDTAALPLNRIPYIRVAMGTEPMSASDKITMDVISLLFDYIFRDPSIPESSRGIFGRLQVPILKAALLDRSFFSDKSHPARRLLDRLASGAVGSTSNKGYRVAFEGIASRVVDTICRDFVLDLEVFDRADRELAAFLEGEQHSVSRAITDDIEAALDAEARESDRAHARALVRDRLAGLRVPADVRMFVETAWADYLTVLRQEHGERGAAYRGALQTMDNLLWSITAKERSAQKARLTKMVPGIIGSLRKGCAAVALPDNRAKPFFDTLYDLHIAAIRPRTAAAAPPITAAPPGASGQGVAQGVQRAQPAPAPTSASLGATPAPTPRPEAITPAHPIAAGIGTPRGTASAASGASAGSLGGAQGAVENGGFRGTDNFHDYVSEIAVGTWLAFREGDDWINARLTWVSPLRTKYIFTSRLRSSAFVHSPEELAWELAVGRARIVLEPVPLFDRAVSAALDSIAAKKSGGTAAKPVS
ncbi:MAG: DUF1631 domain-containing protein [Pseudomonadota bacterium]|nr:DUF1631 domain-containing protein [Pseudomonadota bacterium]